MCLTDSRKFGLMGLVLVLSSTLSPTRFKEKRKSSFPSRVPPVAQEMQNKVRKLQ